MVWSGIIAVCLLVWCALSTYAIAEVRPGTFESSFANVQYIACKADREGFKEEEIRKELDDFAVAGKVKGTEKGISAIRAGIRFSRKYPEIDCTQVYLSAIDTLSSQRDKALQLKPAVPSN